MPLSAVANCQELPSPIVSVTADGTITVSGGAAVREGRRAVRAWLHKQSLAQGRFQPSFKPFERGTYCRNAPDCGNEGCSNCAFFLCSHCCKARGSGTLCPEHKRRQQRKCFAVLRFASRVVGQCNGTDMTRPTFILLCRRRPPNTWGSPSASVFARPHSLRTRATRRNARTIVFDFSCLGDAVRSPPWLAWRLGPGRGVASCRRGPRKIDPHAVSA